MIRNDLHTHSVQSICGIHTLLELVEITTSKGMRSFNVCDHDSSSGKTMSFGVIANPKRMPRTLYSRSGKSIQLLAGIETAILNVDGDSMFPERNRYMFDLVSAGFHRAAPELLQEKSPDKNTKALENFLKKFPLDIITHPCIATFPLHLNILVELSLEYGFALEVNNTNLRVGKTNREKLREMVFLASEKGARLVENSDGHCFYEIGENDQVEKILEEWNLDGNKLFLNRNDSLLDAFLKERQSGR